MPMFHGIDHRYATENILFASWGDDADDEIHLPAGRITTARYAGTCRRTGLGYPAGTIIEEGPAGWEIAMVDQRVETVAMEENVVFDASADDGSSTYITSKLRFTDVLDENLQSQLLGLCTNAVIRGWFEVALNNRLDVRGTYGMCDFTDAQYRWFAEVVMRKVLCALFDPSIKGRTDRMESIALCASVDYKSDCTLQQMTIHRQYTEAYDKACALERTRDSRAKATR